MDVVVLSRLQFALTVSFHFLFPPLTIGLSLVLIALQTLRLVTGRPVYQELARFWTRVFGLIFAIGVATGIPLQFQFGTNWAGFARFVGDIFASPLAIEGIYAFFLESGFLALLLFGGNRIGPRLHWLATVMVALGAHFSAIWILVANSWMQTPAGYHLARRVANGGNPSEIELPADTVVQPGDLPDVRAVVHSFSEAIMNPSMIDRLTHTLLACWMTGAFLTVGVSAWWLLRGRHREAARTMMTIGLALAVVSCLLQGLAGDATARGVARRQPTKFAALEGLSTSGTHVGLSLFGWVGWQRDESGAIVGIDVRAVRIPGLLSVLVSGDLLNPRAAAATPVAGLADLPNDKLLRRRHPDLSDAELTRLRPQYWPNVPMVFQTYHLMVALGVGLTILTLGACMMFWAGRLTEPRSRSARCVLWLLVVSPILSEMATQAGWMTAELGRQPWIVYEVLLTRDAVSGVIDARQVATSVTMFVIVYSLLFVLFVTQLLRLIRTGPDAPGVSPADAADGTAVSLKAGRHGRT